MIKLCKKIKLSLKLSLGSEKRKKEKEEENKIILIRANCKLNAKRHESST